MMETTKAQARDTKAQGEERKAVRALIKYGASQRSYREANTRSDALA
jgi:hypothetical protein